MIAGFLCAFGLPFTGLSLHPPIWLEALIWLPLAAVVSVGLPRPFRGMMIALQFHNHAAEARHGD